MELLVLTNKDEFPTEEIIFSHIGRTKSNWVAIFNHIESNYPDFNKEWKYYNDGKCWLLKVTRKSKTICWVGVYKSKFKISFYFNDRAEPAIFESSISEELKEQFKNGRRYNKIRGLSVTFGAKKNVEYVKTLIDIKLKVK